MAKKFNSKTPFGVVFVLIAVLIGFFALNIAKNDVSVSVLSDQTGTVSERISSYIIKRNDLLYAETGARIIIVADHVSASDKDEYAEKLLENYRILGKETEKVLLLFVDSKDKTYGVFVGRDIERAFSEESVKAVLDAKLLPFLKQNDVAGGVDAAFKALLSTAEDYYGKDISGLNYDEYFKKSDSSPLSQSSAADKSLGFLKLSLRFIVIAAVVVVLLIAGLIAALMAAARSADRDDRARKQASKERK